LEEAGWELWSGHYSQRQNLEIPSGYPPF
jgi:hypothetical protein